VNIAKGKKKIYQLKLIAMNSQIIILVLICLTINCFGQQTNSAPTPVKSEYLQKSKDQKTGGFILLGLGAGLIAIAAPGNVSFDILPVLVIGGTACLLTSIPLFIASSKNKRKASKASVFFKMEKTERVQHVGLVYKSYPALLVRLNL
jgi:hypothetical protein